MEREEEKDVIEGLDFVEPLDPVEAKPLILKALEAGRFSFRKHATDRASQRSLDTLDMVNVLRCGVVEPADFIDGTWRHRVWTPRMSVVVAFRDRTRIVVITAWRNER